MQRVKVQVLSAAVCVALGGGVVAQSASAASRKASFSCSAAPSQSTSQVQTSSCTGKPFGKITARVDSSKLPTVTYRFRSSKGTFKMTAKTVLKASGISGTWRVSNGTGKFSGITGTGKLTGALKAGSKFTFTGTVRY